MRIVVALEYSGQIRSRLEARGHDAISVDLLPTEIPGNHFQGDIWDFFSKTDPASFDMMIGHPACTMLCNSGARWFYHPADSHKPEAQRRPHPQYPNRWADHYEAVIFFKRLWELPIQRICLENPIPSSRLTRVVGKYHQIIQPYEYGDPATKATCLWLKGLSPLVPTNIVPKHLRRAECHTMSPGPDRGKERARTYPGIADAMASQWC